MKDVAKKVYRVWNFSTSSQLSLLIGGQILIGLALTMGSLFLFLKFADRIIDHEVIATDLFVSNLVYMFRTDALTQFMKSVTFFGGEIFLVTATILTILFLTFRRRSDALVFTFVLIFGVLLNFVLKDTFQRPRPNLEPLVIETSYSFPSGHAMNSFIFYTAFSYFIFRKLKPKPLSYTLMGTCVIVIGLIGISRIYLGAHYLSDVLAGYAAGLCWFISVLLFEKSLVFLRLYKKFEISIKAKQ